MKFQLISDENRKIHLDMDRINLYVSRWRPHTPIEVEIVRRVAKKSDPQRAYYFSTVVSTYAEEQGYEIHEYYLFHCFLKFRYFGYQEFLKICEYHRSDYRAVKLSHSSEKGHHYRHK